MPAMPKPERVSVTTSAKREVIDITEGAQELVTRAGIRDGLCHLFVQHTTAALVVQEVGEGTEEDLLEVVDKMIPKIEFRHAHDPSHAPDHMIASVLGPSLTVPVEAGQLSLGTWQRVLLVELNGPRERSVLITCW